jgi:hypothetical protein
MDAFNIRWENDLCAFNGLWFDLQILFKPADEYIIKTGLAEDCE